MWRVFCCLTLHLQTCSKLKSMTQTLNVSMCQMCPLFFGPSPPTSMWKRKTRPGKQGKWTAQEIPKTIQSPVANLPQVPLTHPKPQSEVKDSFSVTNKVNNFNLTVDTYKFMRQLHSKHFFSPLHKSVPYSAEQSSQSEEIESGSQNWIFLFSKVII